MKLTIIPNDGAVYIDGESFNDLVLEGIPSNVHALQASNGKGWIEFNDNTPNENIEALPHWANMAIEVWNNYKQTKEAEKTVTAEQKMAAIISERNRRLAMTDWTELPSVVSLRGSDWSLAWQSYRQALRDMPNDLNNPINVDAPEFPIPPAQ